MAELVHPLVTPFSADLIIQQGATFRHTRTWQIKNKTTGVITNVDLTGCQARARFWDSKTAETSLFPDLTTETGGVALGGASGTIAIYISDEQTRLLDPIKSGWWTLEILWQDGDTTRIMEGVIELVGVGIRG